MLADKILTKKKFCELVEEHVFSKKESYMDALTHLMSKLEAEARNLNFLERINTLPLWGTNE